MIRMSCIFLVLVLIHVFAAVGIMRNIERSREIDRLTEQKQRWCSFNEGAERHRPDYTLNKEFYRWLLCEHKGIFTADETHNSQNTVDMSPAEELKALRGRGSNMELAMKCYTKKIPKTRTFWWQL